MSTPNQPQPPAAVPPVDPGNNMLTETPAQLTCAHVDTPAGKRLAVTIRTASTTLTVLLDRDNGQQWGALITQAAATMSSLIVAGAGGIPIPVNGNAKPVTP